MYFLYLYLLAALWGDKPLTTRKQLVKLVVLRVVWLLLGLTLGLFLWAILS